MKTPLMILCLVLLLGSVSAVCVDFYYSDTCPYCQQIKPFVFEQQEKYPEYIWNSYETSNEDNYNKFSEEGFKGVPAFVIKTNDGRVIKVVGANEPKLSCEFQEMSTKDCRTLSADHSVGGSWFLD